MGHKGKKHTKRVCEPSTGLERVVLAFMDTVRTAHRDEVEMVRDMGQWAGRVAEKLVDESIEQMRDKRAGQRGPVH